MKKLKIKIIVIATSIILLSGYAHAQYISGQYDVCVNQQGTSCASGVKYTYALQGFAFPTGASNINVGWDISNLEGAICSINSSLNPSIEVMWYDYSCGANSSVRINYISYSVGANNYSIPFSNLYKSVNDLSMGTIASINGPNTILYANTNQVTYSIPSICGANYYEWTVSGSGWAVDPTTPLTGATATTIKLNPSQTSNCTISVKAYLDPLKTCGYYKSQNITVTRPIESPVFTNSVPGLCLSINPNKTFNINPVANAQSYSWTFPSGWTGTPALNGLSAFLNFNNIVNSSNVCVKSNFIGGVSSSPTCFNLTTYASIPTVPSTAPLYTVASTIDANKKAVTFKFPSYVTPYGYSTNVLVPVYTGANSSTYYKIMTNNETIAFWYNSQNSCGNSIPTDQFYYKLINGSLVRQVLQRIKTPTERDENIENLTFKIFPNPTSDDLNISYFSQENDNMILVITDIVGNIILKENNQLNEGENNINLQLKNFSNGIYFLSLDSKGFSKKEKIVIEK